MKVVILIPFFPPIDLNGSEIAAYNIAKNLSAQGHEVHVITALHKGFPKYDFHEGFHIHRIEISRNLLFGIILYTKCILIIHKIDPDIIHAQGLLFAGFSAFLSKKILNKPYVAYGRGSDVYISNSFLGLIERIIIGLVLGSSSAIISLTQNMKSTIFKFWAQTAVVIPNGVDWEKFSNLQRHESRQNLNIAGDEKIIIFVGSIRHVKGVEYLIEAIKIVKRKYPSARLMLVGAVEHEKIPLMERVTNSDLAKYVQFIGNVPVDKIPIYMTASDIFVLPSISEGFPLVVLEAMASGLPVVATRVGGIPEIIIDGQNGFLVEPRNPAQIADRICLLLGNDDLRKEISIRNKANARSFGWNEVCYKLECVYRVTA